MALYVVTSGTTIFVLIGVIIYLSIRLHKISKLFLDVQNTQLAKIEIFNLLKNELSHKEKQGIEMLIDQIRKKDAGKKLELLFSKPYQNNKTIQ